MGSIPTPDAFFSPERVIMRTKENRCILESRIHVYWEAFDGELHGSGSTETSAIADLERKRNMTVGTALPHDIIETVLFGVPSGNRYQIVEKSMITGKMKAYNVSGVIVYLAPTNKCRWLGDSRITRIQDV